jgi:hypothetical protein
VNADLAPDPGKCYPNQIKCLLLKKIDSHFCINCIALFNFIPVLNYLRFKYTHKFEIFCEIIFYFISSIYDVQKSLLLAVLRSQRCKERHHTDGAIAVRMVSLVQKLMFTIPFPITLSTTSKYQKFDKHIPVTYVSLFIFKEVYLL